MSALFSMLLVAIPDYARETLPYHRYGTMQGSSYSIPLAAATLKGETVENCGTLATPPTATMYSSSSNGNGSHPLNYNPRRSIQPGDEEYHPNDELDDPSLTPIGDMPIAWMAFLAALVAFFRYRSSQIKTPHSN